MKIVELPLLRNNRIVPFLRNDLQIYHLVEWVIEQVGPVNINATTFSVAEEFLRAMHRLRREGKVKELNILCDLKAAQKTAKINTLLRNVADNVYMGENHSKIVLLQAENARVCIITSQNQTRGNRWEGGIITTDEMVYDSMFNKIADIIANNAVVWRKGEAMPEKI